MFTFAFSYEKEDFPVEFENVTKAEYNEDGLLVTIEGDKILEHRFPVDKTLYLFSEEESFSVSCHRLRCIRVTKED